MASSVAGDESLREPCTRHGRERDTAYSNVVHFKDANARLSATGRDLEEAVARLRCERDKDQEKLTKLLEQVRKGQSPRLQTGCKKTHRGVHSCLCALNYFRKIQCLFSCRF